VAAPAVGLTVHPLEVRAPDELSPTFAAMTREHAETLLALGPPVPLPTHDESWTALQSGGGQRHVIGWRLRAA
jgi:hypothetical protein